MKTTELTRWVRAYLRRKGYVLVSKETYRRNHEWQAMERRRSHAEFDSRSKVYELQDQIRSLEAEIEAHKAVEAKLAERAITAEMSK